MAFLDNIIIYNSYFTYIYILKTLLLSDHNFKNNNGFKQGICKNFNIIV